MADANDSDGSWEFVDKDSDSETSSITHPYDTGLPDEIFNIAGGEEVVEPAGWTNNEDDITDSDIEACTEEVVESETEEGLQKSVDALQTINDTSCSDVKDQTDKDQEEEVDLPDHNTELDTETDIAKSCRNNTDSPVDCVHNNDPSLDNEDSNQGEAKQSESTDDESDDIMIEEAITEVALSRSSICEQGNDIMTVSEDVLENQTEDNSTKSQIAKTDSSDSEYEKLERTGNSDFGGEFANTESEPETISLPEHDYCPDNSPAETNESDDTGSTSDFTILASTCKDPEQDGITDMDTCSVFCSQVISTATHRSIGMVTDHPEAPGLRFKISFIVISFGVGFLLGFRYPQNESPVVLRHTNSYRNEELTETYPLPENLVYSDDDILRNEGIHTLYDGHIAVMKKLNENTAALRELREKTVHLKSSKAKLQSEIARTRYINRQMKFKYEHMMEENKRFKKEKESYERALRTHQMLKSLGEKQENESKMKIMAKEKEIQTLKERITSKEQENIFFNRTLVLYQRLQSQHHKLLQLNRESADSYKVENARHETRIRQLKQQLGSCRFNSMFLTRKPDPIVQPNAMEIRRSICSEPISPLLQTIAAEQDSQLTCLNSSKYRAQFRALKRKMEAKKLQIKKLSESNNLKSLSVEILYRNLRSLSDLVNCVNQQANLFTPGDARDPLSFCRGLTKPQTEETKSVTPTYKVHGTMTLDLKHLDLEFDLNLSLTNQNITQYNMRIAAQPCEQSNIQQPVFFDAPFFVNLTVPLKISNAPEAPLCKFNEYNQVNTNRTVPVPTSDFIPAILYNQSQAMVHRARYQVARYRSDLWVLNKKCSANEHALVNSIQQTENAKNSLYIATEEVRHLRKQRSELREMLQNVTTELIEIKKPSAKQCFQQIIGTEELLRRIGNTSAKSYKAIKKYAQAVNNITKRAWTDMLKYVDQINDMAEEKGQGKEFNDHTSQRDQHHQKDDHDDDDDDEDDEKEEKKWEKDDCHFGNRWTRKCKKSNRDEWKQKRERERQEKKEQKKKDIKAWKIKREEISKNMKRFRGDLASKIHKKLSWAVDKGKKFFHKAKEIVHPAEVKMGKKVLRWVPLKSILQRDIEPVESKNEETIFQWKRSEELHTEIKADDTEEPSSKEEEKPEKENSQLLSNETTYHKPPHLDQSSGFMSGQKFGPVKIDRQAVDTNLFIHHQTNEDKDGPRSNIREIDIKNPSDPLWYSKLFEERKRLREKGYGVGRFTEDEFDWFLKMFETRQKMRMTGDDSKDWFLEMFEARAKLRFTAENDLDGMDQKNWYLKMFEARDKSRSKGEESHNNWHLNMYEAREGMRRKNANNKWLSGYRGKKEEDWYSKRGKSRQYQRDIADGSRDELHGVRLNGQKTKPSTFDKESILGKTVVR